MKALFIGGPLDGETEPLAPDTDHMRFMVILIDDMSYEHSGEMFDGCKVFRVKGERNENN